MQRCLRCIALVSFVTTSLLFRFNAGIETISTAEAMAQTQAGYNPKIIRDIPYTKKANAKTARRQSLDLYLPPRTNSKPPLVVFIHGGFWTLSDDDYRIGPAIADVLLTRNLAVALVRYRLAPKHRHPAQARDVAAAVAHLVREADKYGYDPKKIFLAGHSAGAHLAALVALDSSYLTAQRTNPKSLAGVIAISGLYDLSRKTGISETQKRATGQAFGNDPATLKAASPITHVRENAPSFLILAASSDFPGFLVDARKFATALRVAGHRNVEQYVIPERDHFSMVQLADKYNEVRSLLLAFFKVQPLAGEFAELIKAKRGWINPPFSTVPFWRHKGLIRSQPIDRRFVESLVPIYGPNRYELLEWPLERFYFIDLFAYLDSLPQQGGRGNYLIITNLRNEKQFWSRAEIEPYKPVIVIGMDDENNLFRLGVFYRGLLEYSWKSGPRPPMMARPLGAFIYFLKKPPAKWRPLPQYYALTINSFQLVDKDPLAALGDVPEELLEVLTYRNGCIYCHSFRGIGSRAHHIMTPTGAGHGGFALPLEKYPADVWRAFVFNQEEVAAKIGASPNIVAEHARQELYDLVVEYRAKQPAPTK